MASIVCFFNFLCSVNSQNHFFVSLKSVVSISKHFCVSMATTSIHCNVSITLLCGVLCGVHIPVKSSKTHLTSLKVRNWMRNQPLSDITSLFLNFSFFRWFKFTLKPPYTVAHGNLSSAIWDTSHLTSFVKFGLKTAWDISYDILWPILKYVNFWRHQGRSSNLSKKDAFRKSIFSRWRSNEASTRLRCFRWAGP